MTSQNASMRCPRCRSRSIVQGAVELRPGVEYLTLRCIACGLVHNAQIASEAAKDIVARKTTLAAHSAASRPAGGRSV